MDKEDPNIYDHVIMAADVGSAQQILNRTYAGYNKFDYIKQSLVKCNNNSIGMMKIAPDYRVNNNRKIFKL